VRDRIERWGAKACAREQVRTCAIERRPSRLLSLLRKKKGREAGPVLGLVAATLRLSDAVCHVPGLVDRQSVQNTK